MTDTYVQVTGSDGVLDYISNRLRANTAAPGGQGKVQDTAEFFTGGELHELTGNGSAQTVTFSQQVYQVWVTTTGVEGRVDPFGGTAGSSAGIRILADTPTPIPFRTTTISVYAASGDINVVGYWY